MPGQRSCRQFLNRLVNRADAGVSCGGTQDRDLEVPMLYADVIVVTCRCGTLPLGSAAHRTSIAAWQAAADHVALTARPSGPVCTPVMSRDTVPAGLAALVSA
jgi:hypothetical protein